VLRHGGTAYLAVFNFSGRAVSRDVALARVGLEHGRTYAVTDLWTGATSSARGSLPLWLDTDSARLLQLD
jgi:hypothetical protein